MRASHSLLGRMATWTCKTSQQNIAPFIAGCLKDNVDVAFSNFFFLLSLQALYEIGAVSFPYLGPCLAVEHIYEDAHHSLDEICHIATMTE